MRPEREEGSATGSATAGHIGDPIAGPIASHPEWADEQAHLDAALSAIGRAVERPLKQDTGAGDIAAVLAMELHRAWRRVQLREALDAPFFARIDFAQQGPTRPGSATRPVETYYIGKTYFEGDGVTVTGWQAPVAALFYRSTGSQASYVAPAGEQHVQLHLKRRLVIDHGELRLIADDLDERTAEGGRRAADGRATYVQSTLSRDEALRSVLSGGASTWLRDIIATIQPDQYALIAAPANQVLLIQGVAGSGKTSIALHRLSYLIYPALMATAIPPRCLLFGPNHLFLRYVSAVLPKLGLQRVVQTTIADWALERMGLKKVRRSDLTFEALLSPRVPEAEKEILYRRSRLKTSRRMGTLLERYVEWRRGQIAIPDEGWAATQTVQRTAGSIRLERRIPAAVLRATHSRDGQRPLAVHRAQFAARLVAHLNAELQPAAQADEEAQAALGRRRLEQAQELGAEVARLRAAGGRPAVKQAGAPAFGAAPTFGAPLPRAGSRPTPASAGRTPSPGAGGAALAQQIRQLEQAAARRRQEGEELLHQATAPAGALPPDVAEQARRGTKELVQQLVDANWPSIDLPADYFALLDDESLLRRLAEGTFDDEEVALLARPARRRVGTLDLCDLPAIHYLFVISQGPEEVGRQSHEYVVIDEAQDVAELDLHCLHLLEWRHSFTLLGDLAQSIYGHRGLTSWAQAEAIFAGAPYTYEECGISYRTTAEITALANRVLRSLRSESAQFEVQSRPPPSDFGLRTPTAEARAFDRHGPQPALVPVTGEAALVEAVARAVAGLRARGYGSIAIIAKTPERARDVAERLESAGVPDIGLAVQPDFAYRGGVVALPVWLAKGLEFDASIVLDADARTYSASAFDGRLLYVALTRAMHELHVLWKGEMTSHLRAGA